MRRMILGCGIAALAACGFDGDDAPEGPLGGSLTVTGNVVDFETGAAVTGTASVSTSGLLGGPSVTTQGAAFTITGIPENSAFQVLAGAPPTHRSTFSSTVVVEGDSLDGVTVPAVSEAFLARIATAFGVTPTAARGVLFVRAVDAAGMPRANVAATTFVITGGVVGPKFLDANLNPLPTATATTASGWAVFFEVPAGVAALGAPANATVEMATSPINAGVVTLADATVTDGAQVLPTNVSFLATVFPIFSARGCIACHSGGGIGKDLGGLHLDGGANLAYRELVEERPNTRVKLVTPETSLVLTHPSREDPPDRHPNITFASPADKDFLKILVWIREGAKNN
ncbi:MAG: hypothetical protein H0T42_05350 [Deltaproteobacteria bacterium]|nr:hypothetical protein [Deltaproteobacteria bacterium]